ncbi:MAG: hypothetical protein AAFU57_05920 [Bacteroidota bacterium]
MKLHKNLFIYIILLLGVTSCVQETHLKTVTFKVDATGLEGEKAIGIRGNFTPNAWEDVVPLTDEDRDGIYEIELSQKTAASTVEFKFVNGETTELEGKENRTIQFEYREETLVYETQFDNPEANIRRSE